MKFTHQIGVILCVACLGSGLGVAVAADKAVAPQSPAAPALDGDPRLVAEARLRSRLLHETIHGALQVMHRDLFEEGKPIPSASLEDVFAELEKTDHVKVRWLVVNAKAMNVKNRPTTTFDHAAADAIAEGSDMFEASTDGTYQYAGKIVLGNACLKCHVPDRTTLEDRKAAVVISMPLKLGERTEK